MRPLLPLIFLTACSTHPGFWRIELDGTFEDPANGEQKFKGRGIQDWAGYYPTEGDPSEVKVPNWKEKVAYADIGYPDADKEWFRWEFYFTLPDHRVLEELADLEWDSNVSGGESPIGLASLSDDRYAGVDIELRVTRVGCFDVYQKKKKVGGRLEAEFEGGYRLDADFLFSGFGPEIQRDSEGGGGLFGGGGGGGGGGCRDSSLGICTYSSSDGFTESCENDGDNNTTVVSSCTDTGISCSGTGTNNVTGESIPVTLYFDDCGDIQGYSVNSFCDLIGSSTDPC